MKSESIAKEAKEGHGGGRREDGREEEMNGREKKHSSSRDGTCGFLRQLIMPPGLWESY